MPKKPHIFIASDLHLGAPNPAESIKRERHFVAWLDSISDRVTDLYLLGDIFDFWFEYKAAIPKGHVRILGKLAELSDQGVQIHLFAGNHDLWYGDYFEQQLGAHIYYAPIVLNWFGQTYYLGHGDGLGPGDHGYKFMKRIVTHPVSKWFFKWLHPDLGIRLAYWVSHAGGNHKYGSGDRYENRHLGDNEFLYAHVLEVQAERQDIDTFIFGHRHIAIDDTWSDDTRIVLLGDWIQYYTFFEISESETTLQTWAPYWQEKMETRANQVTS